MGENILSKLWWTGHVGWPTCRFVNWLFPSDESVAMGMLISLGDICQCDSEKKGVGLFASKLHEKEITHCDLPGGRLASHCHPTVSSDTICTWVLTIQWMLAKYIFMYPCPWKSHWGAEIYFWTWTSFSSLPFCHTFHSVTFSACSNDKPLPQTPQASFRQRRNTFF